MASNWELIAVWMDFGIGEKGAFLSLKERFRNVSPAIKSWLFVDNDDQLGRFIVENPVDKIVLVTSGCSAQRVVGSISLQENIHSIYIFCGRVGKYNKMRSEEPKIRCICDNEDELYDTLKTNLDREFPSAQ